jgi:hypothetical protein|nr:MAG TPA: hypothetical protein [Caudoviricetes sp.]DAW81771.1 MAG TPA: hypothetical protein [Caudoviricetes sp.]DAX68257.1 MAG TPA: hypothetical protein [Caudoviricetes sp.]
MANQADIDLVKANIGNHDSPNPYPEEYISALLDHHKSVAYVSYKLCLLKTRNDVVTLGPISLKGDADYWKQMAQFFYDEYKAEQQEQDLSSSSGSTILMKRADGT